jgi:hypothetical protein
MVAPRAVFGSKSQARVSPPSPTVASTLITSPRFTWYRKYQRRAIAVVEMTLGRLRWGKRFDQCRFRHINVRRYFLTLVLVHLSLGGSPTFETKLKPAPYMPDSLVPRTVMNACFPPDEAVYPAPDYEAFSGN